MKQKHRSRMRGNALPVLVLLAAMLVPVPLRRAGAQTGDSLVVVINPRNLAAATLSKGELKAILLGDKTNWANGAQIPVILGPPGDGDRAAVLKKVSNLDESVFQRRQLQASFSGGTPVMVREVRSAEEVKAALRTSPLAVGFLHKKDVDGTVKAVFEVE
jgi:ABC-type phosphate transport system substrate-binding protein